MNNLIRKVRKIVTGMLVLSLLSVGMIIITEAPAMAASCNLTTTNSLGGSYTSGYCGNNRVSLSTTNSLGSSHTRGYVGNNRYSSNTTNNLGGTYSRGYVGSNRISLSTTNSLGSSHTRGYVGSNNCFFNC